MSDLNLVTIEGRLTRSPELSFAPGDIPVCNIYIANNRYIRKKDTDGSNVQQLPTFVKITLWNEKANTWSGLLAKGDKIIVQGRLSDDNYENTEKNFRTSGRLKLDHISTIRILEDLTGHYNEEQKS